MTEIFDAPVALQAVVVAALIFGFAPRAALRLITLAWPRDHPRRRELHAELAAVEYWKRPIWIAEQLETAIFDGLVTRFRRRAISRRDRQSGVTPFTAPLLTFAYVIGEKTGLGLKDFRLNAFLVKRRLKPPFREYLTKVAQISGAPAPRSRVYWTKGKGVLGWCWQAKHAVVLQTGPYRAADRSLWQVAPQDVRLGMTWREFSVALHQLESCAVAPLLDDEGRVRGCISAEFRSGIRNEELVDRVVPYLTEAAEMLAPLTDCSR